MPVYDSKLLSKTYANLGRRPGSKGRGPVTDKLWKKYKSLQMLHNAKPVMMVDDPKRVRAYRSRIDYLSKLDGFPVGVSYNRMIGELRLYRTLPCMVHPTDIQGRSKDTMREYHLKYRRIPGFDRYGFGIMRPAFHWRDMSKPLQADGQYPLYDQGRIDPRDESRYPTLDDVADEAHETTFIVPYHLGDIAFLGPFHMDKHGQELIDHFYQSKLLFEKRHKAKINAFETLTLKDDGQKICMTPREFRAAYMNLAKVYESGSHVDAFKYHDYVQAMKGIADHIDLYYDPDFPDETSTDYDPKRFFIIFHKETDIRYHSEYGERLSNAEIKDEHDARTVFFHE